MIAKNTKLSDVLKIGEKCDKCGHCCRHGAGALFGDDIKSIAKFLGITEDELREKHLEEIEKFNTKLHRPKTKKNSKPYGVCVFYNNGCTIQPVKPLECRTGNCSEHGEQLSLWFMLNHFVNPNDPESVRQYATYLKSGGKTLPGGELEEIVPDKKKLRKILSYEVLR